MPALENGIRLYRMKLNTNIPSCIHLGSASLRVRYWHKLLTCRRCDEPDYQAISCHRCWCFNCHTLDHSRISCQEDPTCAICEEKHHQAKDCPQWQIWEDHLGEDDMDHISVQLHRPFGTFSKNSCRNKRSTITILQCVCSKPSLKKIRIFQPPTLNIKRGYSNSFSRRF